MIDQQRIETAFHEAGHYVALYRTSQHVYRGTISIVATDDVLGWVSHEEALFEYEPDGTLVHSATLCADAIVVALAGMLAELRVPGADPVRVRQGAERDLALVAELLAARRILSRRGLRARCTALLDKHWAEVSLLAAALLEHGTLGSEAADLICDLAVGDPYPELTVRALWKLGVIAGEASGDGTIKLQLPSWWVEHVDSLAEGSASVG